MSLDPIPRCLDPENVTAKMILAVLSGESAEDQIGRNQAQIGEAVDISAAVEAMSQSNFASHEIAQAVARNPYWFPQAYVILMRYVQRARQKSGQWLDRQRLREAEERTQGRDDALYHSKEAT